MSSLRSQHRVSLCSFTFSDGRRCRAPRQSGHPLFCCFHARKQAQTQAAADIGRDISHFFSGRYLSACDLNAALGRLFAATARGHVKPKTARTLAYLAQVMVQCIHLTQDEYSGAFGGDAWRNSIRCSVDANSDYLHPASPQPAAVPLSATPPAAPAPIAPCSGAFTPPSAPPRETPAAPSSVPASSSPSSFSDTLRASLKAELHAASRSAPISTSTMPTQPNPSQQSPPTPCSGGFTPPSVASSTRVPAQAAPAVAPPPAESVSDPASKTVPPPLPPGFGAPANWDVLIPSKPAARRRTNFRRRWNLQE